MSKAFSNKVVTITGGARGIGLATARYVAKKGAVVSIADVLKPELETAVEKIKSETPHAKVKAVEVDVTRFDHVKAWIRDTKKDFGKIDGCLNGAGIAGTFGKKIVDYEDTDFDSVIDVNLKRVFNCLRAQLGVIEKGGSIVNIPSVGGLHGLPGASAYIAPKFAVRGLTRTAAQEVAADGTRVNAICPGAVDTDMMKKINETLELTADNTPQLFKRSADPSEIAALIAFLLGDESKYMTGADYRIDAGYCA